MSVKIASTTPRPTSGAGTFNEWIKTMQDQKVFISSISHDIKHKTYENLPPTK
jgi:hypothetical protein